MDDILKYVRFTVLVAGIVVLAGIVLFVVSLMLPIQTWRTGELPSVPLPVEPGRSFSTKPTRIWIDTDAACGQSRRTDPDDCLAILLLTQEDDVEIVGMSTVFGNAPLSVTDRTTRTLMAALQESGLGSVPVYRGSSEPMRRGESAEDNMEEEAHEGLRAALAQEPLTIVSLGPLTNVAMALEDRPSLQSNVTRLVAVMGRRKGHLFHPIEGGTSHSLLGHGPVFRDFNFSMDEAAATAMLATGVPMTFVTYEAARDIAVDSAILDGMAARDGAPAWVAQRAGQWLGYWREDIGREGFYPFDLVAAAYVVHPWLLQCADVSVSVDHDTGLYGWLGVRGLFVSEEQAPTPLTTGPATYCPGASMQLQDWLFRRLAGTPEPQRSGSQTALVFHQVAGRDRRMEGLRRFDAP
jgi:inosine-uridine nucleoside N-ribohydrolase